MPEGAVEIDGGWPRSFEKPSGASLVIYEPQVASWDEQKHVIAHCAVAHTAKGAEKPDLGSIKLEADTSVSLEERLVRFGTIHLTESNFPKLSRQQAADVTTFITIGDRNGGGPGLEGGVPLEECSEAGQRLEPAQVVLV